MENFKLNGCNEDLACLEQSFLISLFTVSSQHGFDEYKHNHNIHGNSGDFEKLKVSVACLAP